MRVEPRRAGAADAAEIATLLDAFNAEFETPSLELGLLEQRVAAALATDAMDAWLVGSPVVALALVSLRPNVWYAGPTASLDELYVVPELRGQGIGTRLMEHVLADATARGVGTFEINVDEPDVDAMRFYRRLGFADTDETTGERMFFFYRDL